MNILVYIFILLCFLFISFHILDSCGSEIFDTYHSCISFFLLTPGCVILGRNLVGSISRESTKDILDASKRIHELIDSIELKQVLAKFETQIEQYCVCTNVNLFFNFLVGHWKFLDRGRAKFGHSQSNWRSRERSVTCDRLDPWTSRCNVELLLPGWVRCAILRGTS